MVGTFPLNVQAGSPQYTLAAQITPSSSTSLITVSNPDSISPITNAYYTIQNEDGSRWCTFYVTSWETTDENNYTGYCTYSSSNTSDVFPEGSICWCIWCKEYYDSLIAQIGGGGGNTVKVSQLVWDTDLVIPDGKAIESASGEVGINSDGAITANSITSLTNLVGVNAVISGKQLVVNDNDFFASVTFSQIPPSDYNTYTSPDFTISGVQEGVQYIVPPIDYTYEPNYYHETVTFSVQAKLSSGQYQTISSSSDVMLEGVHTLTTQQCITPAGTTALRYVITTEDDTKKEMLNQSISSSLSFILTPLPVYAQLM